jgi:hypothetical protein
MKFLSFTLSLLGIALLPTIGNAAPIQASISLACSSNDLAEINLAGVTFVPQKLASEGYTVKQFEDQVRITRGNQTYVLGTATKFGGCDYTFGMRTSVIELNPNLNVDAKITPVGSCRAVTTDGDYGVDLSVKISLSMMDDGDHWELDDQFTQGFNSMGSCQNSLTP